ncbi:MULTISPECIES: vanadium-dependent haloperoxidase [unclassified Streptomyces]|uniref:vanadium-dependent haloperoxidase n=1 Tax=unclassified Streptomyces TaxID=2593676 RepID=UPI00278BB41E|nr:MULTISPECIES: vanadium-dependent haloperoxidase [unclassified Streptomyces]
MPRTTRTASSRRAITRRALVAGLALTSVAALAPAGVAATSDTADTAAISTATGSNDHVLYWNNAILDVFRKTGGTPGPLTRGGAMMDLAIYDAVNSIRTIGKPYLTKDASAEGAYGSLNTAIDYAAYTSLRGAFPNYPVADLDSKLRTALAMPDRSTAASRDRGRALGTKTAQALIDNRVNDGSADTTPYVVTDAPGHWRPAAGTAAGAPNWGKVKPFALTSGSQFRPGTPNGFASAADMLKSTEYAKQVNEIKRIGGKNSTERTADQTELAHYWANDVDGTYKPVGQQYDHALTVFRKYRPTSDSFQSARLFGLTSATLADAAIAIWDSKYGTDWDLWRPVDAITRAGEAPNADIVADPAWEPLESGVDGKSFTPNFPTYVSGHSGIAGAWAGILRDYFGRDDLSFTGGTDDPYAKGVTRSFPTLSAAAQEKADSRKYIGVHFEWDNAAALDLGYRVADQVYANIL